MLRLIWRAMYLAVIVLLADAAWLGVLWASHAPLAGPGIPESSFMQAYRASRAVDPALRALRWQPVSISAIPRRVVKAFVLAEDARFFVHHGFDFSDIRRAALDNIARGRVVRGASGISQQTAKNLFLSPRRTWLRKWHETLLTIALEALLSKQRILEIYLNIVELGPGLYGVNAAAHWYWGIDASKLSTRQAVELAATLRSPAFGNPARQPPAYHRYVAHLYRRVQRESYPRH